MLDKMDLTTSSHTDMHDGLRLLCLRRYLQDLPAGLSTFNDTCLAQQHGHQTVQQNIEHVRSIVQVLLRCGPSLPKPHAGVIVQAVHAQ